MPTNPEYLQLQAQSLHERMFGDRSQMDLDRLSLAQQGLMLQRARDIESATNARARIGLQIRRNISAAAAIERLGLLEPGDSKFQQKLTQITAQYPDALGSTAFQKILEDRRQDHQLYQTAEAARVSATFNDPDVAKTYEASLANTNDPKFANAAAKATEELKTKAKSLFVSTDLSAEQKATVYNATDGTFNLDPKNLTQLELTANAAKAQRAAAEEAGKPVKSIVDSLKALGPEDPADPQAIKDARYNLQQSLKDKTFVANGGVIPPSNKPALNDYLDKHLGAASAGAPPLAAAPVTPAVTPAQAAAEPAVAAPPPPVPATGDNADPDDILNEPSPASAGE